MLLPFIFSFHPALRFDKTLRAFFPASIVVALVFVVWDMWFTRLGVWGFNPRYLCGIYLYNLPLEEILFFFCIPYASLFTYHCMKKFLSLSRFPYLGLTLVLMPALLIGGIFFAPKYYTTLTFMGLALMLLLLLFYRPTWLAHFYVSFAIILLPFFIVNGILTGTWINEPVVWYNNAENMGIRLFTIPLEDVFYGMLLLLLNTWLYETLLRRSWQQV